MTPARTSTSDQGYDTGSYQGSEPRHEVATDQGFEGFERVGTPDPEITVVAPVDTSLSRAQRLRSRPDRAQRRASRDAGSGAGGVRTAGAAAGGAVAADRARGTCPSAEHARPAAEPGIAAPLLTPTALTSVTP